MILYNFFSINNFSSVVIGIIIIILMFLFGIFCLFNLIKNKSKFKTHSLLYLFFTLLTLMTFYTFISTISELSFQYNHFVKPYYKGEYLTVEGNISDYNPAEYSMEASFDIDGVHFEYNPYSLFDLGFNNRSEYIKNGNRLKIEYVYVKETSEETDRNVIMKIEK